jgi:hypothetical protein
VKTKSSPPNNVSCVRQWCLRARNWSFGLGFRRIGDPQNWLSGRPKVGRMTDLRLSKLCRHPARKPVFRPGSITAAMLQRGNLTTWSGFAIPGLTTSVYNIVKLTFEEVRSQPYPRCPNLRPCRPIKRLLRAKPSRCRPIKTGLDAVCDDDLSVKYGTSFFGRARHVQPRHCTLRASADPLDRCMRRVSAVGATYRVLGRPASRV